MFKTNYCVIRIILFSTVMSEVFKIHLQKVFFAIKEGILEILKTFCPAEKTIGQLVSALIKITF